jgi:chemotaxis protein methyltransferase CheR
MAVARAVSAEGEAFFEDQQALASLVCLALPALLPYRCSSQRLRIWFAGCATGQGAFSLAMTLAELCPRLEQWKVEIVASDADATLLCRARSGIYRPSEVQRGLPTEWLVRHLERLPAGHDWRFKSPIADQMTWLHLDPARSCAAVGIADIIFWRQRLGSSAIDSSTHLESLARMTDQLAPDGFVILAAAEPTFEHDSRFEAVGNNHPRVYRRLAIENALLTA